MIERAAASDIPEAAAMLADAFENDPNAAYFFTGPLAERKSMVREPFEILLSARIELSMPVFVSKLEGRVGGGVMGYDTTRPDWPPQLASWWSRFEAKQDGLAARFNHQDEAVIRFKPAQPHYYLGVVGVHPGLQGKGLRTALIKKFCGLSDADPASSGIYLETANADNAAYYQRLGFRPTGEADLDPATRLQTMFRPAPQP